MTSRRVQKTFNIGVLGDFSGRTARPKDRTDFRDSQFVPVDSTTIAKIFSSMRVEVRIELFDQAASGAGESILLEFSTLLDFSRSRIALQVPKVMQLKQLDAKLAKMEMSFAHPDVDPSDIQREDTRKAMQELCKNFRWKGVPPREDLDSAFAVLWDRFESSRWFQTIELKAHIIALRQVIGDCIRSELDHIMLRPEICMLKATWCGLIHLLEKVQEHPHIKVQILDVSKRELLKDIESAAECEDSHFFHKVYANCLDTPGGVPFSLLVGAYDFDNHPDDFWLLRGISTIAASSWAPFIASASPAMFELERFEDMHSIDSLSALFSSPQFIGWNSFRVSEDAKFVSLCLPRILLDVPREMDNENYDSTNELVPCNAAYGLVAWLACSHTFEGWCLPECTFESLVVPWLQRDVVRDLRGEFIFRHRTNVVLEESKTVQDQRSYVQPMELVHFGFLPVCQSSEIETCHFGALNSVAAPRLDDLNTSSQAFAQSWLTMNLHYLLPISAIATHIKSNLVGQNGLSDGEFKVLVENLVSQCIPATSTNSNARFPFIDFKVRLKESKWNGKRIATVNLTLGPITLAPGQVLSFEIQ